MEMENYLPKTDNKRLEIIFEISNRYNRREITEEEAKEELLNKAGKIKPYEIALAEQQLKHIDDDECQKEDIQRMLNLFKGIMDTDRPDLDKNHPIMCYYRENDVIREIISSIEDLVQYPVIKNQWYEIYDKLDEIKKHFSRKQNQLYATLEKKGFDRPTTTMWTLDDFVRDEIKEARDLLDENQEEEFIKLQNTIIEDLKDLLQKEESVLYPTALSMLSGEDFKQMAEGDKEIGFAWIEVESSTNKQPEKEEKNLDSPFAKDLASLLSKYNIGSEKPEELDVATGKLSLEQINLIFKHLPVDLSYVDENELVRFYSDTKHRVFPRSKNVIGRNVKNCHPRASVHIVEEILKKFRSGEEDTVEFWINKEDVFIYIHYTAVRDEEGRFKGVLEMMQDASHIRKLEGTQTLLNWGGDSHKNVKKDKENTEISGNLSADTINENTKLKELFQQYPKLREEMEDIHPAFSKLKTPLARIMVQKADIKMMSKNTGMDLQELIAEIKKKISR